METKGNYIDIYNDIKLKKGKEIKNDINYGTLIFRGEYKNEKYYKGKEYNYDGELIFEGE